MTSKEVIKNELKVLKRAYEDKLDALTENYDDMIDDAIEYNMEITNCTIDDLQNDITDSIDKLIELHSELIDKYNISTEDANLLDKAINDICYQNANIDSTFTEYRGEVVDGVKWSDFYIKKSLFEDGILEQLKDDITEVLDLKKDKDQLEYTLDHFTLE